jgi:hypothetical protein
MAIVVLLLIALGFLLIDSGINNTSLLASFQHFFPHLGASS